MAGNTDMQQVSIENQEAHQQWLKTNALAALAKTYGAQYGDPQSADAAAQAQARQATVPYAGQQAAAEVAKTTADTDLQQQNLQRQRVFGVARMLQSTADPATGDVDPAKAQQILGNPSIQKLLGIDSGTATGIMSQVSGPGSGARLTGLLNAGMGQAGAMIKGGGTVAVGPDGNMSIYHTTASGAPVQTPLPAGSTTPQEQNAVTGQGRLGLQQTILPERVGIAQQNANTAAYSAGTRANNSAYGAPQGTAPGGQALPPGLAQPTVNLIGGPGRASAPVVPQLTGKPLAIRTGLAQNVVNANTMLGNTNKIIEQADQQISAFTTGPGGELAHIPGTAATNLEHNLAAIKANVAQAVLTSMKGASGSTGMGRVLQSEYTNFQQTLGAIDPSQSAGAVRFHLNLVKQSLARMNATLNAGFKTQYGTDPYTAIGQKPPGALSASDAALLAKYGVH